MKDIISNDQHGDNVNQLGGGVGGGGGQEKRNKIIHVNNVIIVLVGQYLIPNSNTC